MAAETQNDRQSVRPSPPKPERNIIHRATSSLNSRKTCFAFSSDRLLPQKAPHQNLKPSSPPRPEFLRGSVPCDGRQARRFGIVQIPFTYTVPLPTLKPGLPLYARLWRAAPGKPVISDQCQTKTGFDLYQHNRLLVLSTVTVHSRNFKPGSIHFSCKL